MSTRLVADKLGISRMSVNRTEVGTRSVEPDEVIALCALYGVTGKQKTRLIERARGGDGSTAWLATGPATSDQITSFVALETEASAITDVSLALVPGIVQTPEYARAVVGSDPDADWMVATRLARQALLSSTEAPTLRLLMDELVLHRLIGGPVVMREQFEHLMRMADRPKISIQIIPLTVGAHPGLDGSFILLTFPEREPHVYVEARRSGLFLTKPEHVEPYEEGVRVLDDLVMDEVASVDLIKEIAEGLSDERPDMA